MQFYLLLRRSPGTCCIDRFSQNTVGCSFSVFLSLSSPPPMVLLLFIFSVLPNLSARMGMSASLHLSSCANFSPWLSLILRLRISLCVSLHISLWFHYALTPLLDCTLCCHCLTGPHFNTPPLALPSFSLPFFIHTSLLIPRSCDFFLLTSLLGVSSPSPIPFLLLFKGAHTRLGNPALHTTTSRCGLFLTNRTNPRLRTDTVINSHTLPECTYSSMQTRMATWTSKYMCMQLFTSRNELFVNK